MFAENGGFQPFCSSGTPVKHSSGSRNPRAKIQLSDAICATFGGTLVENHWLIICLLQNGSSSVT